MIVPCCPFAAAGGRNAMVSIHISTVELSPAEHQTQLRRAVIASTVGTAIEWYDFFLYSTVTGLVFAKLFFPNSDPWVGTLEAFAIYASASSRGRWAPRFSAITATASAASRP
jgi:hypothetical protein